MHAFVAYPYVAYNKPHSTYILVIYITHDPQAFTGRM